MVGSGTLGGAASGAIVGGIVGGPVGAAVGAGVGATAGATADATGSTVRYAPNAMIDARHADMLNQLASAPPRQFDRLYGRMQVSAHQEASALFTTYASLRAFAQSALPTLQHHLGMARRLPR